MQIFRARFGSTLYLYLDTEKDAVESQIRSKLRANGHGVTWSDGSVEWLELVPIDVPGESGGGRFIWSPDGNQVKCNRVRCVRRGADVERSVIGTAFRSFDLVCQD